MIIRGGRWVDGEHTLEIVFLGDFDFSEAIARKV